MSRLQLTKAQRMAVYAKMHGHCAYCGTTLRPEDMQVDHVTPLARGGSDTFDNMFPACRSCNHYKHTLTVERFRKALEQMPAVLLNNSATFRNAARFGLIIQGAARVVFFFERAESEEHPNG